MSSTQRTQAVYAKSFIFFFFFFCSPLRRWRWCVTRCFYLCRYAEVGMSDNVGIAFALIAHGLCNLNSAINPVIYYLMCGKSCQLLYFYDEHITVGPMQWRQSTEPEKRKRYRCSLFSRTFLKLRKISSTSVVWWWRWSLQDDRTGHSCGKYKIYPLPQSSSVMATQNVIIPVAKITRIIALISWLSPSSSCVSRTSSMAFSGTLEPPLLHVKHGGGPFQYAIWQCGRTRLCLIDRVQHVWPRTACNRITAQCIWLCRGGYLALALMSHPGGDIFVLVVPSL